MPRKAQHFVADGAIGVSRFVKVSTAKDKTVSQCGTNSLVFGVSQTGTKNPPGVTGSGTGASDTDGDMIEVYLPGEVAPLIAGSGGWTAGQYLKSDSDGKGVAITATGQNVQEVGAIALEACAAGEVGDVFICPMHYHPTVS